MKNNIINIYDILNAGYWVLFNAKHASIVASFDFNSIQENTKFVNKKKTNL